MKRSLSMNIKRGILLAVALVTAACGGNESVASKSAAAYQEAQTKGTAVGGGHDHGSHGATQTTESATHTTHGTTATGDAAMDHSAHGTSAGAHAGMDHGATASAATDHSAHDAKDRVDHAAMGHVAGTTDAHASHATTGGATATDHAAMGHGSSRSTNAHSGPAAPTTAHAQHGTTAATADAHTRHGATNPAPDAHAGHSAATDANAHAQHATPPAMAQMDHSQHGAMQTSTAPGADVHAQHGAPVPERAVASAPRSNVELQRIRPAAILRGDAFDAAAPVSVSEAAKAAQGGGHEGHQTRGITPGEDHENPPTPMPATRDRGANAPAAVDHSQHGGAAAPQTNPSVSTVYSCPMHPEVTSDTPGSCPKCGMALVKKEAGK